MDAYRRREERTGALAIVPLVLAGALLVGAVLTLSIYHGAVMDWARDGVVHTALVALGAVGGTLAVLCLLLLGCGRSSWEESERSGPWASPRRH